MAGVMWQALGAAEQEERHECLSLDHFLFFVEIRIPSQAVS